MAAVAVRRQHQQQKRTTNIERTLTALLFLVCCLKVTFSWVQPPEILTRKTDALKLHHPSLVFRRTMATSATTDMRVCSDKAQAAFRGKNVLLTGASGGLGSALALQLAHCGVKSLVLSARSEASLQAVANECQDISSSTCIHILPCDLSNPESVTTLGAAATQACDVDILINNGGVSSRSRFVDTKPEVDAKVMQINFLSGASLAKAVVPGMVERNSGSIIWISSVQGLFGLPERTSYAASKFAVQGYCEALRGELAASGVAVHVASPGYIRTNLSLSALTGDGTPHGKMDSTTAKGADPNDVAVDILQAVANGKADFVVAATSSAKVAPWIRFFLPSIWNTILVSRFEKSQQQGAQEAGTAPTETSSSNAKSKDD